MRIYKKVGKRLVNLFPGLEIKLEQADIRLNVETYLGKMLITSTFFPIILFALGFSLNLFLKFPQGLYLFIFIIPIALFNITFLYGLAYPNLIVSKRVTDIERNLLFSLRYLLVEIRSGISIYDAFLSISNGDYGAVSKEFKEVTKKISVGIPETKALEAIMLKNPSTNFRRVLWQMINAIESGSDTGNILDNLVKEFSMEHRTAIRMYGAQLNSLALVYMIFAIIVPSIGVCFLIILSFFSGFPINTGILILVLLVVIVFQFMFLGIIKSKRPKVD